ncbi:hypothetical protein ABMY26_10170 [Azospirillum sp. HJ39]|uniref:hypothetical protein n=1 Tax=Azospirillum sp. HJ39 TaxID=3159496 RepID=UPI0035583B57
MQKPEETLSVDGAERTHIFNGFRGWARRATVGFPSAAIVCACNAFGAEFLRNRAGLISVRLSIASDPADVSADTGYDTYAYIRVQQHRFAELLYNRHLMQSANMSITIGNIIDAFLLEESDLPSSMRREYFKRG